MAPSAAEPSSTPLPGGNTRAPLLTIRTLKPLPRFKTFHAVPPADASISSFKLSLLLILTGAHSSKSSSKPLTSSEQLKELTMQQWRLDMLTLELRQNSIIAPETRRLIEQGEDELEQEPEEIMTGFELLDDHECALLEEGDEVVIRLKPGHTLAEMKLPPLPSNHKYAAPAGSLTRAGTLSAPPPYSIAAPQEPSSHSSSVAAQPNANFHAHKYRDYSGGWRVVKAQNGTTGVSNQASNSAIKNNRRSSGPNQIALNVTSTSNNLSNGNQSGVVAGGRAAAAAAAEKRIHSSTTRRMSASNANLNPTNVIDSSNQRPGYRHVSSSSNNIKTITSTGNRPQSAGANGILNSTTPEINQGTFSNNIVNTSSPTSNQFSNNIQQSPQLSSQSQSPQLASQSQPQQSNSNTTAAAAGPSMMSSMPLTALVIGPGVQGQVGRNASSASAPMGTSGQGKVMGGNSNAFVGFTAASGEVQPRSKPRRKSSRNKSEDLLLGGSGMGKEAAMNAFPPIYNHGSNSNSNPNSNVVADATERRIAAEKLRREGGGEVEEEGQIEVENSSRDGVGNGNGKRRERHVSAGALLSSNHYNNHRPENHRNQTQVSNSTTITSNSNSSRAAAAAATTLELPNIPSLPPIQNLAPFPNQEDEEREIAQRLNLPMKESDLPHMPSASGAPIVSSNGNGNGNGRPNLHSREDSKGSDSFRNEEEGASGSRSRRESNSNGNGNGNGNFNPRNKFKNGDRKISNSSNNNNNNLERIALSRKPSSLSQESNSLSNPNGLKNNKTSSGFGSFFRRNSNKRSGNSTPNDLDGEDGEGMTYNLENESSNDFKINVIAKSSSKGKEKSKNQNQNDDEGEDVDDYKNEKKSKTKAEKRYEEVQKSLAKEREKQTLAETSRKEEFRLKEEKKLEERKKKELEEKSKKIEEQWKVWEEVRRREKELGLPPPQIPSQILKIDYKSKFLTL